MCGFVGFTNFITHSEHVLKNMMDVIVHRGPDSSGSYIDSKIALGFRRLSILDLKNGDQPMFNEDKSLILIFNGEIYNSNILRQELKKTGHIFANNSDSEVLLHGYEEYGKNIVNKLRGMFAFAIWDKKNELLFAARDIFGIKPFYYAKMGSSFMFGSEIKSFLKHPHFNKELNKKALEQYLSFQYSPYLETFFKGVFKLPPAHYLILKNNKVKINRYYNIEFHPNNSLSLDEWVQRIESVFDDSVNAHKISDVEVGSLLSSGVDSSYIACSANVSKTFTVGFSQDGYSEISFAKELSDTINIKNYSKVIAEQEWWNIFPKLQYHMDEPLADPSAIALYFACNEASKRVKVILSGEGSDEIFGGYNVYKDPIDNAIYEKLPFILRHFISKFFSIFGERRGFNYFIRRGQKIEDRFIGNAYIFNKKQRDKILQKPILKEGPQAICKPFYDIMKDKDDVTKMQFLDLNMWLVGDILLKADKMSMANSIELRVPFLDKKVLELATTIPLKYRVTRKNTKYALRKAALKRMPLKVASKKKLGFPVPIRVWLRQEKYYNIVKEKFCSDVSSEFFNKNRILTLLNQHLNGKKDNSRKIWTIYTFLVWYNQFFAV